MRSGWCSRRPSWAPPTSGGGCSSSPGLPTPRASDGAKGLYPLSRKENGDNLATRLARLLPTPMRADGERTSKTMPNGNPTLSGAVTALLPTPRASANENRRTRITPSQAAGKHGRSLAAEVCCLPPEPATG